MLDVHWAGQNLKPHPTFSSNALSTKKHLVCSQDLSQPKKVTYKSLDSLHIMEEKKNPLILQNSMGSTDDYILQADIASKKLSCFS